MTNTIRAPLIETSDIVDALAVVREAALGAFATSPDHDTGSDQVLIQPDVRPHRRKRPVRRIDVQRRV